MSVLSINVQTLRALFTVLFKPLFPPTQVIPSMSISLEEAANIIATASS